MINTEIFIQTIKPLLIFIGAMTIYSIFIFKFYHFLASRDIIPFNIKKFEHENSHLNQFLRVFNYIIEYIILTPIAILFWFLILTALLVFLSKNSQITTIMLIAISIVGTTRVVAHYNESLASDLAKMLPFALLGVFLVDMTFINIETSINTIKEILEHTQTLIHYVIFIIALELILRIISALLYPFKKEEN